MINICAHFFFPPCMALGTSLTSSTNQSVFGTLQFRVVIVDHHRTFRNLSSWLRDISAIITAGLLCECLCLLFIFISLHCSPCISIPNAAGRLDNRVCWNWDVGKRRYVWLNTVPRPLGVAFVAYILAAYSIFCLIKKKDLYCWKYSLSLSLCPSFTPSSPPRPPRPRLSLFWVV